MILRSLLYVPASSEKFIARAHERGADAIILDLEDAVAPAEKLPAREKLPETVPAVGRGGAAVFVRINSEPHMFRDDAEAACRAGAAGLLVTKTRSVETLRELDAMLAAVEIRLGRPPMRFIPMTEDAGAVLDARDIARGPRVLGLLTGAEDLATAMNAEPTPEVLRFPKLLVHMAAKAAGVMSFGLLRSVADFADLPAIRAAAAEARAFGFDGATCVHPGVVPLLNAAFTPTPDEVDHAQRLIAASDAAEAEGKGAVTFEGKMIDAPIVTRARALLARAEAVSGGR